MITLAENRSVTKIGEFGQESEFSIANNPKAFRVLIGTLYPNKVKAIIRELSSNSYDSHIMAKNKSPFDVFLPSEFEPNFIIRDYGTSMSHEFMMRGYTIAFNSTKEADNDQNGTLGLGRLSALSLCDNYTAVCFLDGVKRSYSVFLNENGKPQIAFLSEENTDEPNGFLVDVPVPLEYVNEFDNSAKELYEYYSICPNIKNRDDFIATKTDYLILAEDGSFGLRGVSFNSMAIMGCYCYPLDYSSIPDLNEVHKQILKSGIVIHFNLGEVDVAANREALHYNKGTIINIKAKLDTIIPQITPIILANFNNKNLFEKMALYHDLLSYDGKLASMSGLVKEVVKGLKIPHSIDFAKEGFKVIKFTYDNYKCKLKKNETAQLTYDSANIFFLANKKIHLKSRAKKYFEDSNLQHKKLVFLYPQTDGCFDLFKTDYDFDVKTLTNAETLPYDKINKDGTEKVFKTLAFNRCSYRTHGKDCWTEEDLDSDDDIIYVTRKGYGVEEYNGLDTMQNKIYEIKKITGDKDFQVFGLTNRQIKNKRSHWKTLVEYHKDTIEEWRKTKEEEIATKKYYDKYYGDFPDIVAKLELDNSSLCFKIYEEYKTVKKIADGVDYDLANQTKTKESNKYFHSTKEMNEAYPILNCVNDSFGNKINKNVLAELNEYVRNKALT